MVDPKDLWLALKGHPATGKSVVAEALARRLRWPLIDKDDAKDHILDTAAPTSAPTPSCGRSRACNWRWASA